jgi:hypothetical protein
VLKISRVFGAAPQPCRPDRPDPNRHPGAATIFQQPRPFATICPGKPAGLTRI